MNGIEGSLWPAEFSLDVKSPAMILNEQAEALSKITSGTLRGELRLNDILDPMELAFEIVAPGGPFRIRLFSVRYHRTRVYPAAIIPPFDVELVAGTTPADDWKISANQRATTRVVSGPEDFSINLRAIFYSARTKTYVSSLIARVNEVKNPPKLLVQSIISEMRESRSKKTSNPPDPPSELGQQQDQPNPSPSEPNNDEPAGS